MRIGNLTTEKTFKELAGGDVFLWENEWCIKADCAKNGFNAMCLEDGRWMEFNAAETVTHKPMAFLAEAKARFEN